MEPILLRTKEAAKLCNIAPKTWRSWNQNGMTPKPLIVGKLHFWRYDELVQWIDAGCPARKHWEACRFTADRATARNGKSLPVVTDTNIKKRRPAHSTHKP